MEGSNGSCDLLDGDGNWFLTSVQVKKIMDSGNSIY